MSAYHKSLLDYALAYARAGYYCFPLTVLWDEERSKKNLIVPFPKAEGWNHQSTRDEDTIRSWFTTPRKGMKGVALDMGKSGTVAIDLDKSASVDGFDEWSKLPEQQDTPMTVVTQSGGMHRFYKDPSGKVGVSASAVAPGIDIRGVGGMVIAAPTKVYGNNGVYKLPNGIVPVAELPDLTQSMIDIISTRQDREKPKFDPAIHGSYKISVAQGEDIIEERLDRIRDLAPKGGGIMRGAIFGYAAGVAQFEGAKAAQAGATLDEDTLSQAIGLDVLSAAQYDNLNTDDLQWIAEGVSKGLASPWDIVADEDVLPEVESDVPLEDLLQRKPRHMPGHPQTAHALVAPVVVQELLGRYLSVEGLGWHEWVGDRWSPDIRVPVRHAVQQAIIHHRAEAKQMLNGVDNNTEFQGIRDELQTLDESKAPDGLRTTQLKEIVDRVETWKEGWETYSAWWYALAHGQNYAQVIKYVEADPGRIYIRTSDLDADPNILNCPNGTVDLRTGTIRRHDPGDYITKSTGVPFDPTASHELWDKARQAFAPGIEEWLQLRIGEGTYGLPSHDDSMLFCFGQGSNGKSTLTDAILNALGDYAVFLHDKALLGSTQDHGTEQMILRGARWGILEELPEAQVLRPAMIKKLIGTSKITARLMRQDNVTFNVTHSLIVNSNHRPTVLENDRGTWRRLVAVPWPWTFKFASESLDDETERRADPAIKFGLSRNLNVQKAALAWIVAGARLFNDNDRSCGAAPEAVLAETASWRSDSDTFGTFFDQELIADNLSCVPTREVLERYNEWLQDLGKKPVSDGHVATRLATIKSARRVFKKMVKRNTKAVTISSQNVVSALPAQLNAWIGLRWQTDAEKSEQGI